MTKNYTIKLNAFFLLIVFVMNTIVGFACALGVDMGFNSSSHHNQTEASTKVHIHDDGKKHVHEKETAVVTNHVHENGSSHQHDSETTKPIPVDGSNLLTKEDAGCCTNEVKEFQDLDKNISVNAGINISPVFMVILSTYFNLNFSATVKNFPIHHRVCFYYPPPTDIRIAIQSFQI